MDNNADTMVLAMQAVLQELTERLIASGAVSKEDFASGLAFRAEAHKRSGIPTKERAGLVVQAWAEEVAETGRFNEPAPRDV